MEEKNASKKRTSATGQLTLIMNGIDDLIRNGRSAKRLIKWMQDARMRWQDVKEKHEDYVIIKEEDDISDQDVEWRTREAQRFQATEIKVDTSSF